METVYSVLSAILPLEAYQYSFMKNAFLAILLVSHDLRFVREYADHVILLDKSVLAQGSAAEVFASPEFSAVFGYSGEEEEAE